MIYLSFVSYQSVYYSTKGINYLYIYILFKSPNDRWLVAIMPSCGRVSKNPDAIKLKNRHPTTGGNVDSTNNSHVRLVDPALPDSPAIKLRRLCLTWRRILLQPRCIA